MATGPLSSPLHEPPVIVTDATTKSIYCVDWELTQSDLAYQPPAPRQRRVAAPLDIAVYADTLTLKTPLVLPGRQLKIVARRLVLANGAGIDVSGADADQGFAPGDLPQQQDESPGAGGSTGADATAGGAGGTVAITVEQLLTDSDPVSDAGPSVEVLDVPEQLSERLTAALAKAPVVTVPGFSATVLNMRNPFDGGPQRWPFQLYGTLQVPQVTLTGLGTLNVQRVRLAADGTSAVAHIVANGVTCDLSATTLQIQSIDNPVSLTGTTQRTPLTLGPFSIEADVAVPIDQQGWTFGDPTVEVSLPTGVQITQVPALTGDLAAIGQWLPGALTEAGGLRDRLRDAVAVALKQTAAAAVAELRSGLHTEQTPVLVVLARGRIGGRGQDGHAGVKGSKGTDGKPTNVEVYDTGTGVTAPEETWGKKGSPGGQAGSAGHSGVGGKGGAVTLDVIHGAAVRVILCADAGPGGDCAAPGATGEGGDGGDGADFLVHDVSLSGNYGHTETGPTGPRGDAGGPAAYGGEVGKNGEGGSVTVNNAVMSPGQKPGAPGSYELIAPVFALDQLLLVQREAKLTYLNAKSTQDYAFAATVFLWLCDICPATVNAKDAKNILTPQDRDTRAAIREAAQVELLRLRRGLDYFGRPYNWVPILRLTHTQHRVTELIELGHIVEQQYATFLDTNATVEARLAALDQAIRALTNDLTNTDAIEGVLVQQISDCESAMSGLQHDIETQVSTMKRDEQTLDDLITRQLADNCSLENIIKIISAVVAIGAGAVNGVSEITGAAEIGEIVAQAKAAAAAAGQLKSVVDELKATTSKLNDLASQLDAVDKAIAAGKPDSVKILAVREDFEETVKPLMEKFPAQAKELRNAVRGFLDLCQTRNEKVLAYNALFVQKAALGTHRGQVRAQIATVNVERSRSAESIVPAPYVSFFKSALTWSKQNLVDLLYEETRAFYYHSGVSKAALLENISDLDIGAIADTHGRLLTAYDGFLNSVGRPYGPFTGVKVVLTRADQPAAFAGLAGAGRMTFTLPHDHPQFAEMTLVKLDAVEVRLPTAKAGPQDELNVAIRLMGEGQVRPVDSLAESDVLRFNAPPRNVSYRYSYDPERADPVIEPGMVADEDYAPLSPFTTWTLDFGLGDGLNRFVTFGDLDMVELRLTGHAFGRRVTSATT
jgi:hypothetical protein